MLRAALVVCAALGGCVQKVDLPIECRPAPSPAGWMRCTNADFDSDFPTTPTAQQLGAFGQGFVMWTSQLDTTTYAVTMLNAESFGPNYDKAMKDALSLGHDIVAERQVDTAYGRAVEFDMQRGDSFGRVRLVDQPARKRRIMLQVTQAPSLAAIAPSFFDNFAPKVQAPAKAP